METVGGFEEKLSPLLRSEAEWGRQKRSTESLSPCERLLRWPNVETQCLQF